jgi:ketosteroid isomerase-like protein
MVVALEHERGAMTPDEMLVVHREHRAAEDRHDFEAVMAPLTPDCFLEQVSLGLRSDGKDDATRAYEEWFGAFPDLGPIPEGIAFGDDVLVAYGQLLAAACIARLSPSRAGAAEFILIGRCVGVEVSIPLAV